MGKKRNKRKQKNPKALIKVTMLVGFFQIPEEFGCISLVVVLFSGPALN